MQDSQGRQVENKKQALISLNPPEINNPKF